MPQSSSCPPSPPNLLNSVETFFSKLYPLPSFSFLHPGTTETRCKEGKLEAPLAFAIHGLVCLYSNPGYQDDDHGESWIESAEDTIWQQLERLTTSRLQALLLIVRYRMETGRFQKAFMLVAVAARFAAAMRLNHEHPGLGPIAQEVRRRIVWSLKLVERYFSIGLPEFELCPFEAIYLQLPQREEKFDGGYFSTIANPEASSDDGAYRLCMRLESVRRDIMKCSRCITLCDGGFAELPKLIQGFEKELEGVDTQMANGPNGTGSTLTDRLHNNLWTPRYVFLYLSWHQCHCDLYRLMLPDYHEAAPTAVIENVDPGFLAAAEHQCLQHAMSIVSIITRLNEQSTRSLTLEFDTAICVYHAIRLIFFISRFGKGPDLPTPEFAMSRADLCLAALKRFFGSSVLVKPIMDEVERLRVAFSQDATPWRSPPPNAVNDRRNPAQKISSIAKVQQRLAIHSLLSRIELADDEDTELPPYISPASVDPQNCHQATFGQKPLVLSDENMSSQTAINSSIPIDAASSAAFAYHSDTSARELNNSSSGQVQVIDLPTPEQFNELQFPLFPWLCQQDDLWSLGNIGYENDSILRQLQHF